MRSYATLSIISLFMYAAVLTVTPFSYAEELQRTAPAAVDTNFPCYACHSKKEITPWITKTWAESAHAAHGIKCPECHGNHDAGFDSPQFTALPGPDKCIKCHPVHVKEIMASVHNGVKCTACHPRHTFSLKVARDPEICATCHLTSQHAQGYRRSKMGVVFSALGPGYSATCQTCHMQDANHNVNISVENRDVMLKTCNRCHSASFAGRVMSKGLFKAHW